MSDIQQAVREKYGAIATSVKESSKASNDGCCGPSACGCGDPITSDLYSDAETTDLPADALRASLGCGNPTALLALEPGQPGSVRELALHLRPGRYVLLCNMSGHYLGGMHTELVVST